MAHRRFPAAAAAAAAAGLAAAPPCSSPLDDPWKISAFILAFLKLFLSILLLLSAAIAWLTSQLVKYFRLDPPCSHFGCAGPRPSWSHKRSVSSARDANGFAERNHYRHWASLRSNSKDGSGDFDSTDEYADGSLIGTSHAYARTSDPSRKGRSGLTEVAAVEGDSNFPNDFIKFGTKDRRSDDRLGPPFWCDSDNEYVICSNCSAPVKDLVYRRRFVKRRITTMLKDGSHGFHRKADDRKAPNISEEPIKERSEEWRPPNSIRVIGRASDMESDVEVSSSSSDSLRAFDGQTPPSLSAGGCARTMDILAVDGQEAGVNRDNNRDILNRLPNESFGHASPESAIACPSLTSQVHKFASRDSLEDVPSGLQDGVLAQPRSHGEGGRDVSNDRLYEFQLDMGDLTIENPLEASQTVGCRELSLNVDLVASLETHQQEENAKRYGEKLGFEHASRALRQDHSIKKMEAEIDPQNLWAAFNPGSYRDEVAARKSTPGGKSNEDLGESAVLMYSWEAVENVKRIKAVEEVNFWEVNEKEKIPENATTGDLLQSAINGESLKGETDIASADCYILSQQGGITGEVERKISGKDLAEEAQLHEKGQVPVQDLCEKTYQEQRTKQLFLDDKIAGVKHETSINEEYRQEKSREEAVRETAIENELGNSQHGVSNQEPGRRVLFENILDTSRWEGQMEETGWQISIVHSLEADGRDRSTQECKANGLIEFLSEEACQRKEDGLLLRNFGGKGQYQEISEKIGDASYDRDSLQEAQQEGCSADEYLFHPGNGQSELKNKATVPKQEAAEVFLKDVQQQEGSFEAELQPCLEDHQSCDNQQCGSIEIGRAEKRNEEFLEEAWETNAYEELENEALILVCVEQIQHEIVRVETLDEKQIPGSSEGTYEEGTQDMGIETSLEDFEVETTQQEEIVEAKEAPTQSNLERIELEGEENFFREFEMEDGVDSLKEALRAERNALTELYSELEEERNASAIAANEAMAMISRLQEEKATMQMELAQYQRMVEEKAMYDQQAMQLLKEILYKREKEKFVLQKEVALYRGRFLRYRVEEMDRLVADRQKHAISIECREPVPLLKGVEEDAGLSSEAHRNQQITESDSVCPDLECGSEPSDNLASVGQKPSKRLKGQESSSSERREDYLHMKGAVYRSLSEGALDDVNRKQCKTGMPGKFEAQHLSPGGHQEQPTEELGRSVLETDDQTTKFILERLWLLEERLRELGEKEELESRKADFDFQEFRAHDQRSLSRNNSYGDEQTGELFGMPDEAFGNPSPKTPGTSSGIDFPGAASQGAAASRPRSMEKSYEDITPRVSLPWSQHIKDSKLSSQQAEEVYMNEDLLSAGGSLPVHDIYEVQNRSRKSRGYPLTWKGKQNQEDSGGQLGKPDLTPGISSHEGQPSAGFNKRRSARTGMHARKLFSPYNVPTYDLYDKYDVNGLTLENAPSYNEEWVLDAPQNHLYRDTMMSRDDVQPKAEELQQLTMRLEVVEADRELFKQTLESLKHKDVGINLLQEIAQHLRELHAANKKANDPDETQMGPLFPSLETYNPALKKRRFWSGPGQTQVLPDSDEIL